VQYQRLVFAVCDSLLLQLDLFLLRQVESLTHEQYAVLFLWLASQTALGTCVTHFVDDCNEQLQDDIRGQQSPPDD
jgi:hypothetical protein